ncbi:MAG: class I SAM-dependent rRNA methyltransferase [Planctomycetes bacterium]|nr:class I SAM-dependent rRNA methyltransferase [Planctomycetota bacterium]
MTDPVRLGERATKLARKGRPWFYADELSGGPPEPALVRVCDDGGRDLGLGLWSPASRLALRLCGGWPGTAAPAPDEFLAQRLGAAVAQRATGELAAPDAGVRLVHGEADGLPGLVVDRFADCLAVQIGSAVLEAMRGELVEALVERVDPRAIVARNDFAVRKLEGLDQTVLLLHGQRVEEVEFREGDVRHVARLFEGHKTGFYLDQRPARAFVEGHARERDVLDAFCYQGAFSLHALAGGARSALAIDESVSALALAERAASSNGLTGLETRAESAFHALRELRRAGRSFGLVIVDPPAFAKSRREVQGALGGYRDLNRSALRLLAPGGLLVTCSCSHHVTPASFEDVVRQAAAGLPFRAVLRARLGAGEDHPVWLALPESEYLKVLVVERQPG